MEYDASSKVQCFTFLSFLLNKMNAVHTSHFGLLTCSLLCVKRQSSVEMLLSLNDLIVSAQRKEFK